MKRKREGKRVVRWGLLLHILFLICLVIWQLPNDFPREASRFFQHEYENGLTLRENRFYADFFALEANQDLSVRRLTDPIEFYATERTEEIVAGFDYFANARARMGFENQEYFSAQVGPRYGARLGWIALDSITVERVVEDPGSVMPYLPSLPDWFLYDARATVGELSLKNFRNYVIYFNLTDDILAFALEGLGHPIAPTVYTEQLLAPMNQLLWNDEPQLRKVFEIFVEYVEAPGGMWRWENDSNGRDGEEILSDVRGIVLAHGFSAENQITVEWVWENPRLAFEFAQDLPQIFSVFFHFYLQIVSQHDVGSYPLLLDDEDLQTLIDTVKALRRMGGDLWRVKSSNIYFMHADYVTRQIDQEMQWRRGW